MLPTIDHAAGNIKRWTIDYSGYLLPGDTLATQNLVSSSTTLTISNAAILLGKEVVFFLNAGVAGEQATITVTVTTARGETKIDTLPVRVNAP